MVYGSFSALVPGASCLLELSRLGHKMIYLGFISDSLGKLDKASSVVNSILTYSYVWSKGTVLIPNMLSVQPKVIVY